MLFRIVLFSIMSFTVMATALATEALPPAVTSAGEEKTATPPAAVEEEDFPVGEESDSQEKEAPAPSQTDQEKATKPSKNESPAPLLADENEANILKNYTNTALLQGLDKVTARTSSLEATVDSTTHFGTLEILVRKCWKSPPEEAPDNKALLEIWEAKPGEERKQLFNGWMLSSSPAVSALEHPVYDITVIECKNKPTKK